MDYKEINIEKAKLKSDINSKATIKECFINNKDCCNKFSPAHSLQENGVLSQIESMINKNNEIYCLEFKNNEKTGEIELSSKGKKVLSTFFGFCNFHDDSIFAPVEKIVEQLDINEDKHCFLLSFRAFAISYHRKKEDMKLYSSAEYYNALALEGAKSILKEMEPYKNKLIDILINDDDYSYLEYFTYELPYKAPVAISMTLSPPYLFSGKGINTSIKEKSTQILTSVIPLESRTLIILATFPDSENGIKYIDELNEMKDYDLQKALTWHIITNSENSFFSPKWYDKLDSKIKKELIKTYKEAVDPYNGFLKYKKNKFKLNFFDKISSI